MSFDKAHPEHPINIAHANNVIYTFIATRKMLNNNDDI